MNMKRIRNTLLLSAGLLLLAGCEKMSSDGLQGRWKPVYARMDYVENGIVHCSYDGPVDETGRIILLREGINHPDVKYEEPLLITGIRFYRNHGQDVFTTFFLETPRKTIGKPLMYRMEDGMIYRELPMGAFINCSPDVLEEGSGKFDEGAPISFLADGKIKIGSITYQRL